MTSLSTPLALYHPGVVGVVLILLALFVAGPFAVFLVGATLVRAVQLALRPDDPVEAAEAAAA